METLGDEMRLFPLVNGVPSGLEFSGGASLPPGDYTLKVAVAEGDRIGTIEHPVHASLVTAGSLTLSELMVEGPRDPRSLWADDWSYRGVRRRARLPGGLRPGGGGLDGQMTRLPLTPRLRRF